MTCYEIDATDFDLPMCVSSGQVFRWIQVGEHEWNGVDGSTWFRTRQESANRILVDSNESAERFRSLFRLDTDYGALRSEILSLGPELAPHLEALNGLRLMRPTSAEETLFCFLCTPNNNLSRIASMVRSLASFGEEIEDGLCAFPSVERIAALSEQELRNLGFGYRCRTIPSVARRLLELPEGWLESLKGVEWEEAHRQLCTLKGVGPKLADCVALYGLHHVESAPVDTHLWQAMGRIYFNEWRDKPLTAIRYREAGTFLRARFGKLAGFAHLLLYLENLKNWRSRRAAT